MNKLYDKALHKYWHFQQISRLYRKSVFIFAFELGIISEFVRVLQEFIL
jgi:hypothetical protein